MLDLRQYTNTEITDRVHVLITFHTRNPFILGNTNTGVIANAESPSHCTWIILTRKPQPLWNKTCSCMVSFPRMNVVYIYSFFFSVSNADHFNTVWKEIGCVSFRVGDPLLFLNSNRVIETHHTQNRCMETTILKAS